MRSDIVERANGRWHGILTTLGVDSRFLRNKHGPCPVCAGRDRYRWDNKDGKGTFYCSNCGAGDGFRLLQNLKGWDFKQTVREIESIIGVVKAEKPRPIKSDKECRRLMQERWRSCRSIELGDPVALYLGKRIGITEFPKLIRYNPGQSAMVALMQDPDGTATMVHSTFLTKAGDKSITSPPRLMMEGTIAKGSAVRLADFADILGIAEGVETALSASKLTGIPCWASLNEGLMQQWIPPEAAKKIIVFGDNDANYVGQSAAYMLARKLSLRANPPVVEVRIPEQSGQDWNDVLASQK